MSTTAARRYVRTLILVAALSLTVLAPQPAYAIIYPQYLVQIHEGSWEYGLQGLNKVVDVSADYKVSSFYHHPSSLEWLEIGWYKYQGELYHFTSWWDGVGYPHQYSYTPQPTDGQTFRYSVRLLSKSSNQWRWWIGTTAIRTETLPQMPWTGRELASSEVLDLNDNAWTHWWDLKLFDYSSWQSWNGLGEFYDNHPNYHRVKIDNTEAYVRVGDD